MHRLFELEDLVEKEIGKVVDAGCVQPSEWKGLGEAVDIMKDIVTIKSMLNFDYPEESANSQMRPRMRMSMEPYDNAYVNNRMMSRDNSYEGDQIDSRGSRDPYYHMNGNSMGQDPYQAVRMLEEKLKNTSDPAMREHLTKTINMLNNER